MPVGAGLRDLETVERRSWRPIVLFAVSTTLASVLVTVLVMSLLARALEVEDTSGWWLLTSMTIPGVATGLAVGLKVRLTGWRLILVAAVGVLISLGFYVPSRAEAGAWVGLVWMTVLAAGCLLAGRNLATTSPSSSQESARR